MSSGDSESEHDEESVNAQVRDLEVEGQLLMNNLLPPKSKIKYEQAYDGFMAWKQSNGGALLSERMMLVYFHEQAKKYSPPTLWSKWSMLKTTIKLRHDINIDEYHQLKAYLKNKMKGWKAKKSSVLNWHQIQKFIKESADEIYLAMKVILALGVFGAMRSKELVDLKVADVTDYQDRFVVDIRDSKNYYPRTFFVGDCYYDLIKRYIDLRPTGMDTDRFFVNYQKGKCTRQVIGKETIARVPKNVAYYLNLSDPDSYTGHCFRRTGATLLANSGANVTMVKQAGGWRSGAVAEGYVENSDSNRQKIYEMMNNCNQLEPSVNKKLLDGSLAAAPSSTPSTRVGSVSVNKNVLNGTSTVVSCVPSTSNGSASFNASNGSLAVLSSTSIGSASKNASNTSLTVLPSTISRNPEIQHELIFDTANASSALPHSDFPLIVVPPVITVAHETSKSSTERIPFKRIQNQNHQHVPNDNPGTSNGSTFSASIQHTPDHPSSRVPEDEQNNNIQPKRKRIRIKENMTSRLHVADEWHEEEISGTSSVKFHNCEINHLTINNNSNYHYAEK